MANKTYGMFLYDLYDLKVANAADTLVEDLNAAVTFLFKTTLNRVTIVGDGVVKKDWSTVTAGEGSLSAGAYSSAALAIMTGKTLAVAGSSPNETTTLDINYGDVLPEFKLYGLTKGPDGDGLQVLLGNCRLTEMPEFRMRNGEAFLKELGVAVMGDANGRIARIIQQQTAGNLPGVGQYPSS